MLEAFGINVLDIYYETSLKPQGVYEKLSGFYNI